jgi:hypothetical protein
MVASIFAFVVLDTGQSDNSPTYNGKKFTITDNGYKTQINGKYIDFYYYPGDLERISLDPNIMAKIKASQGVVFVFDPEDNVTDNLVYIDVMRYELQSQIDKPVYFGITKNSTKYTLPVVDCRNSSFYMPFILINSSSTTNFNVSQEYPDCIIMNGKLKELLALKDRFVYTYYGIMS